MPGRGRGSKSDALPDEFILTRPASHAVFQARFAALSKPGRPAVWCFVYGKPGVAGGKDTKTFVNFKVSNLDFVDLREGFDEEPGAA